MSEASTSGAVRTFRPERLAAAAGGLADGLRFAAAPVFAIMAVLTGAHGGDAGQFVCSAAGGSNLSGMTVMYALMTVIHAAPWLRAISAYPCGGMWVGSGSGSGVSSSRWAGGGTCDSFSATTKARQASAPTNSATPGQPAQASAKPPDEPARLEPR